MAKPIATTIIMMRARPSAHLSYCWQGQAQQFIFHKINLFSLVTTAAGKATRCKHYHAAGESEHNNSYSAMENFLT